IEVCLHAPRNAIAEREVEDANLGIDLGAELSELRAVRRRVEAKVDRAERGRKREVARRGAKGKHAPVDRFGRSERDRAESLAANRGTGVGVELVDEGLTRGWRQRGYPLLHGEHDWQVGCDRSCLDTDLKLRPSKVRLYQMDTPSEQRARDDTAQRRSHQL